MSDVAALIADMVRAGVDPELIGRTAAALSEREAVLVPDEAAERRRIADRERKRLRKSAEIRGTADAPPPSLDKKAPQTPKELNPSAPAFPAHTRGSDFDQFWSLFPNKVGKADAAKAFVKALTRVDFESLMAGLRRYAAKTDDRPWCNPSTWLNQDRWTDEPPRHVARAGPQRPLSMDDFLGTVIEQQERRDAGPDQKVEGASQALRAIPGGRWSG